MLRHIPLRRRCPKTGASPERPLPWGLSTCGYLRVQVVAPPFLDTIAQQLLHAGQQLRLLARLPEHIAGDLVAQLTVSAAVEAEAAAAAATSDPWAAGALSGNPEETQSR